MLAATDDPLLEKIADNVKLVKRIIEDSKRFGWNKNLPHGFRLVQDVETRFGTIFRVVERFLKSSTKVWSQVLTLNRTIARSSYEALETTAVNSSVGDVTFPAFEAVIDAFNPVYDAVVEFQGINEPVLHKILPSLQFCKTELGRIELEDSVICENGIVHRPSIYSMRLYGATKLEIRANRSS